MHLDSGQAKADHDFSATNMVRRHLDSVCLFLLITSWGLCLALVCRKEDTGEDISEARASAKP